MSEVMNVGRSQKKGKHALGDLLSLFSTLCREVLLRQKLSSTGNDWAGAQSAPTLSAVEEPNMGPKSKSNGRISHYFTTISCQVWF